MVVYGVIGCRRCHSIFGVDLSRKVKKCPYCNTYISVRGSRVLYKSIDWRAVQDRIVEMRMK